MEIGHELIERVKSLSTLSLRNLLAWSFSASVACAAGCHGTLRPCRRGEEVLPSQPETFPMACYSAVASSCVRELLSKHGWSGDTPVQQASESLAGCTARWESDHISLCRAGAPACLAGVTKVGEIREFVFSSLSLPRFKGSLPQYISSVRIVSETLHFIFRIAYFKKIAL